MTGRNELELFQEHIGVMARFLAFMGIQISGNARHPQPFARQPFGCHTGATTQVCSTGLMLHP